MLLRGYPLERIVPYPDTVASKDLLFLGIFESLLSLLLVQKKVDVIGLDVCVSLALGYLQSHCAAKLNVLSNGRVLHINVELLLVLELLVVSHLVEDLIEVEPPLDQLSQFLFQVDHYLVDVPQSHLFYLLPALDLVLCPGLVGPVLRDLVLVTSLLLV